MKIFALFFYIYFLVLLMVSSVQSRESEPVQMPIQIKTPRSIQIDSLHAGNKPIKTFLKNVSKPIALRIQNNPQVHFIQDPVTHSPLPVEVQGSNLFDNFTSEQGLSTDHINCSIVDKWGNIWFGTSGGVSRYDGQRFTNYSTTEGLAHNDVWCIIQDKWDNIWFGTSGGVSRFDGQLFTNFTIQDGLPSNAIWSMLEDHKGNLWFGTQNGVSCFNGKSFSNPLKALMSHSIGSMLQDKRGNLWFATLKGVCQFDGKSFSWYTTRQGLSNNVVNSMLQDKKGYLWFGTSNGISRYDGSVFTNFSTRNGLDNLTIFSVMEDKKGNIWFGGDGAISRYDGQRFVNYNTTHGLANAFILCMLEDHTGSIWFGTAGEGISRYDGDNSINFTTAQGLVGNKIMGIQGDRKGNIWFCTLNGLSRYNGSSFINYTSRQGLLSSYTYKITEDHNGKLWIATLKGISCFNGYLFTNYTTQQGLVNNDVNCILEDRKKTLWFGTHGGVSHFNGKSFTNYTTLQGIAGNSIYTILEDRKGNIWFGTDRGISRFDGKSITTYSLDRGLTITSVYAAKEDKAGNLWFATSKGISRFDGYQFTTFPVWQHLVPNVALDLWMDSNSNIIIGSKQGIGVLTGFTSKSNLRISAQNGLSNEKLKSYTPQIEIYNPLTGYSIKNVRTIFQDEKGVIWLGTESDKIGVVRFDYSAISKNQKPPIVNLHQLKISGKPIAWYNLKLPALSPKTELKNSLIKASRIEETIAFGRPLSERERDSMRTVFQGIQFTSIQKWYPIPKNLVLPYQFNDLTFEFATAEPVQSTLIRYQYQLEGHSAIWSVPISNTSIQYGNLREGLYTFKVKAQGPSGVWGETMTFRFRILPPPWRTWWAYILYFLMAGLLIWAFVSYRLQALKRKNRALKEKINTLEEVKAALLTGQKLERRRVAADLHDNLGGMMSAIRLNIEAMDASKFSKIEKEVYENVLNMTRQAYTQIRLLSHNLQPEELEKHGLWEALSRLMTNLNASQKTQMSLKGNHFEKLSQEVEFNLYSICLELANNIVKHSDASEASFEFVVQVHQLQLFVVDNGKGFIADNTSDGIGIRNIQERTRQMGGTLKMHSRPGEGIIFQFIIPLDRVLKQI